MDPWYIYSVTGNFRSQRFAEDLMCRSWAQKGHINPSPKFIKFKSHLNIWMAPMHAYLWADGEAYFSYRTTWVHSVLNIPDLTQKPGRSKLSVWVSICLLPEYHMVHHIHSGEGLCCCWLWPWMLHRIILLPVLVPSLFFSRIILGSIFKSTFVFKSVYACWVWVGFSKGTFRIRMCQCVVPAFWRCWTGNQLYDWLNNSPLSSNNCPKKSTLRQKRETTTWRLCSLLSGKKQTCFSWLCQNHPSLGLQTTPACSS